MICDIWIPISDILYLYLMSSIYLQRPIYIYLTSDLWLGLEHTLKYKIENLIFLDYFL